MHWYHLAAEQGHARAMNQLARCQEKGWGCVRDPLSSIYWYRRSAEAGYFRAQYNYGLLLLQFGRRREAEGWFERAERLSRRPDRSERLGQAVSPHGPCR